MKYDYYVYILKCNDNSFYTGVTNDLDRRINEHNTGEIKGFTSSRLPVKLVYSHRFTNIDDAIKFEKQVKGWSRKKKEALINNDIESLIKLSNEKKI